MCKTEKIFSGQGNEIYPQSGWRRYRIRQKPAGKAGYGAVKRKKLKSVYDMIKGIWGYPQKQYGQNKQTKNVGRREDTPLL